MATIIASISVQHGVNVNRRNRDNLTCLDLVKEQDGDLSDLLRGDSALLDAAKKGNLDRVKKLLTLDNINCRDKQGRNSTPLHLAGGPCGSWWEGGRDLVLSEGAIHLLHTRGKKKDMGGTGKGCGLNGGVGFGSPVSGKISFQN